MGRVLAKLDTLERRLKEFKEEKDGGTHDEGRGSAPPRDL
jgi:hypothetical protein